MYTASVLIHSHYFHFMWLGYVETTFKNCLCMYSVPFRLFPTITEVDEYHLELTIVVKADFPEANHGSNVALKIPVPKSVMSIKTVSGARHCIINWGYTCVLTALHLTSQ